MNEHPAIDAVDSKTAQRRDKPEAVLSWGKLLMQPVLILFAGAAVIAGLGMRKGWAGLRAAATADTNTLPPIPTGGYICPMMCTPPQSEPGRCPVCAMELVPATSAGGKTDPNSVQIDLAARRLANIRTVAVKSVTAKRALQAIGELSYDEGTLKSISAYVDGRLDRLYADYTGIVVKKGDHLALVYSPVLYSSQVELLLAKQSRDANPSARDSLYESAKQRLLELGMTKEQLTNVETTGKADNRIHLCAPISGTVIEKLAVEGQYVKEGQAIYKLADLSTVWLMLKMFPEDAAVMRYGQKVEVDVQSLPGRGFTGRVAFIDPMVDRKTRTVGVRVVMPNEQGLLRVGDYAKATVDVPLAPAGGPVDKICDPRLANKWISPRHPHVVASAPGRCEICGVDLVPASRYGFTDEPVAGGKALVVPRNAVLMAGDNSVVYVETEPGRFEIRQVVLGPSSGDEIVLLKGAKEGELVATSGNFLIDSQMQLAGNPSLIDPARTKLKSEPFPDNTIVLTLAKLDPQDLAIAKKQRICPVADQALGSMGVPIKIDVKGTPVFICCEGCRGRLLKEPNKYLERIATNAKQPENAPEMDLPPIDVPMLIVPGKLPKEAGK